MDIPFWLTPANVKALYGNDYRTIEMFSNTHLIELALIFIIGFILVVVYKKTNKKIRKKMLIVINILLWVDEIFKYIFTIKTGQWIWNYLPLHLCSINIFVCTIHTFKPSSRIKDLLYAECIPGALIALLISPWFACPVFNAMHLHSYTIHALLIFYSLLAMSDKGYKPQFKNIPFNAIGLIIVAIPMYFINILLNTNFMYLNKPEEIFFTEILFNFFGKFYFLTFPFLCAALWLILYLPWIMIKTELPDVI